MNRRRGTVLAGIGIFVGLLLVIQLASGGWGAKRREARLRTCLVELRNALAEYESDHGFLPCTTHDYNQGGDPELFIRQLTEYTDENGKPSPDRTDRHGLGPYLRKFPEEPITGTRTVVINRRTDRLLPEMIRAVVEGTGHGGWYYEARSGNIVPNLGSDFEEPYAAF
jgi:hypothetical protein